MYGIKRLGGCCGCCGAPMEQSKTALWGDKVGARSLLFIEGEAIKNKREWGLPDGEDPNLIAEKQDLHLFPKTNVIPPMMAMSTGVLSNVFGDGDSGGYNPAYFVPPPPPAPAPGAPPPPPPVGPGAPNVMADNNYRTPVPPGTYFIVGTAPRKRRKRPAPAPAGGALP